MGNRTYETLYFDFEHDGLLRQNMAWMFKFLELAHDMVDPTPRLTFVALAQDWTYNWAPASLSLLETSYRNPSIHNIANPNEIGCIVSSSPNGSLNDSMTPDLSWKQGKEENVLVSLPLVWAEDCALKCQDTFLVFGRHFTPRTQETANFIPGQGSPGKPFKRLLNEGSFVICIE